MTMNTRSDATRVAARPDSVVVARFAALDSILWLEFADGLERAVPWADLPLGRRLGPAPVAVAVGLGGDSIVLFDGTGAEISVDAGSLRASLDEEYRVKMEAEDDAERRAVGATIRVARESAGLSQLELARRSGMAQESLSRIETGRRDHRLGTLRKLAKGMGLSLDEFLDKLSEVVAGD